MLRNLCLLAVFAAALSIVACNKGENMEKGDVNSLVQAERTFAATTRSQGMGPGFLSVLDSSAVVFQPGPMNGVELYSNVAPSAAILAWRPTYAEVSASGDLGYTSGPWEYYADSAATDPVVTGQYNSIWRWDSTGVWRLVLDIGIPFKHGDIDTALKTFTLPEVSSDHKVTTVDLMTRDRALAARANTDERAAIYSEVLADDARLMRPGMAPLVGAALIKPWVQSELLVESTFPQEAFLSADGSLGYVYGRSELTASLTDTTGAIAHGGYVRIWRWSGGQWRLALDVLTALPGELQKLVPAASN